MFDILKKMLKKFDWLFVTNSKRLPEISETRYIFAPKNRDITSKKLVMESLCCPYCQSTTFVKKGFRMKKREKVQLYLCLSCHKVFTQRTTKGKHYPLAVMLDAISIYNLGYSLEQTCRIVNQRFTTKKEAPIAEGFSRAGSNVPAPDTRKENVPLYESFVKWSETWRKAGGTIPIQPLGGTKRVSGALPPCEIHLPTTISSILMNSITLQPSTLANWIAETEELCRFCRMREYAIKRFSPKDMVITATLAHRQLYRYRFHRGKCDLIIREEYGHRKFAPLAEFLELVPSECPHQYFSQGLRASEAPFAFSKTAMIVRGKTNYATRLAAFVLQSVADRKSRHEAIQKCMLANDSVTVASEVPVYLTRDDMEHMKTQLGFEVNGDLPKLITGHIDFLQIRNGQIHILDYKPAAAKEQPIEQLTLYAMALSRLTGLRLFEFKCAWFDEKDYFEFYPLHVLHKPKKAQRRRNVTTKEGTYAVNKNEKKIEEVRPKYI